MLIKSTETAILGEDGKYHYTYKVIDKKHNYFYVGRHSSSIHPSKDNYLGSGLIINKIKKKDKTRLVRIELEYFDNAILLEKAEQILINENINTVNCLNILDSSGGFLPGHIGYFGENHPMATITNEVVKEIKILLALNIRNVTIAKKLSYDQRLIAKIKAGTTWNCIIITVDDIEKYKLNNPNWVNLLEYNNPQKNSKRSKEFSENKTGEKNHNSKINTTQAKEIKILLALNCKTAAISRFLNISQRIVHSIKFNEVWKHIEITEIDTRNYIASHPDWKILVK